MPDRRFLLATVAGLFGLAAFRWLRAEPAQAAEKFEIEKSDAEWRETLTPEQYHVLREKGTERPFTGALTENHETGNYHCAGCGAMLFLSGAKSGATIFVKRHIHIEVAWLSRCHQCSAAIMACDYSCDDFSAAMGAEGVRELLRKLDVGRDIEQLRTELAATGPRPRSRRSPSA